jgi:hypothetical protein
MRLGRFVSALATGSALALALTPGTAGADAAGDYSAIHADYAKDRVIAPCAWTTAQLDNALRLSDQNPEDEYNGFPAAVEAELKRWRDGKCKPAARPRYTVGVAASPLTVRAGAYRTFTFAVFVRYQGRRIAVPGAKVRFAGKVRTTNSRGTATVRLRFVRAGTHVAVFTRSVFRLGTVSVRVLAPLPKRRAPKRR